MVTARKRLDNLIHRSKTIDPNISYTLERYPDKEGEGFIRRLTISSSWHPQAFVQTLVDRFEDDEEAIEEFIYRLADNFVTDIAIRGSLHTMNQEQ